MVSMVADLAHLLGMETGEAHLVVTTTGSVLEPNLGLRGQGIEDGAILSLAPVREHVPAQVHDDVVEAAHSLSRIEFSSWGRGSVAVSSRIGSAWLLGLGVLVLAAVGALHPQEAGVAAVVAGAGAAGLLIAASRRAKVATTPGRDWRSVGAVWFACAYAALAGALAATASWPRPISPVGAWGPMLPAATAALGAAGIACILLRRDRLLVSPVMALGATVVAGTFLEAAGLMADQHWVIVVATVWVVAARVAPGLAMDATVLRGESERRDQVGAGVDTGRLRTDLLVSHDVVLAVDLTAVGLLLLAVPSTMAKGLVGCLWLLALTGLLALRLRRARLHAQVATGLGGVGLVMTALVAWSPQLPVALVIVLAGALVGAGVLVGLTEGSVSSLRAGWLGDRAEVLLTAAAVPLALLVIWPSLIPGG